MSLQAEALFPVVLSAAKDLTLIPRPMSDRSVRSFAALRMTRKSVGDILQVLLVRGIASSANYDYGLRDFDVADLDGNMLFFWMEIPKNRGL
jgi:hypothetical protein